MDGWMDAEENGRPKVPLGAEQTGLEPKGPDSQPRYLPPPPCAPGGSRAEAGGVRNGK